jgi:hypothetical protein
MGEYQLIELIPSSVHIVISLPKWVMKRPGLKVYRKTLSRDFDPAKYEIQCGWSDSAEEFDWSIYLHRGDGDGIWYRLEKREVVNIEGNPNVPKQTYTPIRTQVTDPSPRTTAGVVCMINMLQLPDKIFIVSDETQQQGGSGGLENLQAFLDQSTRVKAVTSHRSLVWAISVVFSCFQHVNKMTTEDPSPITPKFELFDYIRETVGFAYNNVSSAYQLPRPVLVSKFGISLSYFHPSHRERGKMSQLSQIVEEGDLFFPEHRGEVQADQVARHQTRNRARNTTNEVLQRETAEAYRLLREVRQEDLERRVGLGFAQQAAQQAMTHVEAREASTGQTNDTDVFGRSHPRLAADQASTTAQMGAALTTVNPETPHSSNFPIVGVRTETRAMANPDVPEAVNRGPRSFADRARSAAELNEAIRAVRRENNQSSGVARTESATIAVHEANRAALSAGRQAPAAAAYQQQFHTPQQAAAHGVRQPVLGSLFYDSEEEAHYEAQLATEAAVLLEAQRHASDAARRT